MGFLFEVNAVSMMSANVDDRSDQEIVFILCCVSLGITRQTTIAKKKCKNEQKIILLHQRSVNIVSRMKNYQLAVFPVNLTVLLHEVL